MAPNLPKKNRPNYLANLEKLVEGFTLHAADVQQLIIGGAVVKSADIVAKLDARVAQAKVVGTTNATWRAAVEADKAATQDLKPFLSNVRQALLVVLAGKTEALADFGLTARKKPTMTPQARTAAALKAKATRVARGTMGKKQKAKIVANVEVAAATAVPVKTVPVEAGGATPAAAPATPATASTQITAPTPTGTVTPTTTHS